MRRALELAVLGHGRVSPNPMVGCVIVHRDRVIGEGWHREYGGPHAEVHAINSVSEKELLKESTVYVTLEPCAHYGKTPPCAGLLADHQVKRVVICNTDPNPLVAGKGISIMEKAGINVELGLLEEEGYDVNRRFFTFFTKKRTYIILKWAETADGFIARENYDSKWISNTISRKLVHKWRAEEDAVLVGKQTAKSDNPSLNVRDWTGKHPLRLVIDRHLELPSTLKLLDGKIPTVCYNLKKAGKEGRIEFVHCGEDCFFEDVMTDLYQREIQSVLVEGGSAIINYFFQTGLWDEARRFRADTTFGRGIPAPVLKDAELKSKTDITGDELTIYKKMD
jgi:diaminohydroxyphosphoribosylaminopyrimidine deaminase/5-amino-6-(5-phosphoribosylamino)uracil reductase